MTRRVLLLPRQFQRDHLFYSSTIIANKLMANPTGSHRDSRVYFCSTIKQFDRSQFDFRRVAFTLENEMIITIT